MLFPKDPRVAISKLPDGLSIEWCRDKAGAWSLIVMGLVIELMGVGAALMPKRDGSPRSILEMVFLMGMMSCGGMPVIYTGLAALFNRTRIEVTRSQLKCQVQPLRTTRPLTLPMKGVKQFFAAKSAPSGQTSIYVMDAFDHVHTLSKLAPSTFAASQICHELNTYFGLEELPVHGITDRLPSSARKSLDS